MLTHHDFSPSKLDRIESCPYSWRNCLNWKSEDGKDAQRGANLHSAIYDDAELAKCSDSEKSMIEFIRKEHIQPYVEAGLERYVELQVFVTLDECVLTYGYIDDLTISKNGKIANLKDWKFGSYEVEEAKDNKQIWAYVCGVFQKFPNVEKVYATIVQPIYGAADYDKQACFERKDLCYLLCRINEIIEKAKIATVDDANATADNCRYCNKLNCPVFKAKMGYNFFLLAVNPESLSEVEQETAIEYADRLLVAEKEIKDILKTKTAAAKKAIIAAGGSENFRVQAGRVTKKTDWKLLAEKFGITDEDIAEATEESVDEPCLMPRMRKKKNTTKEIEERDV